MKKGKVVLIVGMVVLLLALIIGLFCWQRSLQPDVLGPGDFPEPNPTYMLCMAD